MNAMRKITKPIAGNKEVIMSKLLLQALTGVVGLMTLALGGMQLVMGVQSPVYGDISLPNSPILDSNLRFFGGLGFGLGVILLLSIVNIEQKTMLFRVSWALAFIGGVGRLISLFLVGSPSMPLLVFTIIEVVGAPIFVVWQSRLS